ncbi:Nucleotide-binding universal stress protein, UspA family [Desulfacinum hydrothermale DSM 13146]|uniref:Nucleotide-binding universal stress protein, UspA family n=1 Tax=Desulfacinum hydrothermale DSM 13146 TaxID=1121390 RepID=A0A1W1XIV1_9BACT|nr:universal stress protein [Desulfacinum hydrothermale]SMC23704.1 Nucleotide-binding universal stress protein, UspA family [Desulfacinum hydrothermale DSM 13146]
MERKCILMAVDGSERCLQAVSRFGSFLGGRKDCCFLLLHCVQQNLLLYPGELWDADTSLRIARDTQEKICRSITGRCRQALLDAGYTEEQVEETCCYDSLDPGMDILKTAEREKIRTLTVGRRGLSTAENLLLGSVSSRVAHYSEHRTVWVMDPEAPASGKVLLAVEGRPECRAITYYVNEWIAPTPGLSYTLLHIMPPLPPAYWDDGHILDAGERNERQEWRKDWEQESRRLVDKFMDEARHALQLQGIADSSIETKVLSAKRGIAQDLLREMERGEYEAVLMGKRSFKEQKPFLMGSHANKVLHNARKVHLCLVGTL